MIVSEVMWREVPRLGPDETVRSAAVQLLEANVGALPVVDAAERFLGIVTERGLMRRAIAEGLDPDATSVSLVLETRVPSCDPEDPAAVALARMDELNVRWLPVLQGERLVGMVGARDIHGAARREELQGLQPVSDEALRH